MGDRTPFTLFQETVGKTILKSIEVEAIDMIKQRGKRA